MSLDLAHLLRGEHGDLAEVVYLRNAHELRMNSRAEKLPRGTEFECSETLNLDADVLGLETIFVTSLRESHVIICVKLMIRALIPKSLPHPSVRESSRFASISIDSILRSRSTLRGFMSSSDDELILKPLN